MRLLRITRITVLLSFSALAFSWSGQAQELSPQTFAKKTIHFPSGRSRVQTTEFMSLDRYVDSLRKKGAFSGGHMTILIEGHADSLGNYKANQELSRKRAEFIRRHLVEAGIKDTNISLNYWGPDRPAGDNSTRTGRKKNRRVELIFSGLSEKDPAPEPTVKKAIELRPVSELFDQLATEPERFCIDWRRDTVLRCRQGSVIYIRAFSLVPGPGCDSSCVTFSVKEDLLNSDMLLDNLSTTSDGQMLRTQGMIHTEAHDCAGRELDLQPGKDNVIFIPTDSIDPVAGVFTGQRGPDSVMNWKPDSNSILSNFSLNDINGCFDRLTDEVKKDTSCSPCPFFFCRIGRIGKAAKGIFSHEQRQLNTDFRRCQQTIKVAARTPVDTARKEPHCIILDELLRRYKIPDHAGLGRGIYKPLLDSFKVKTVEALADTLKKIFTRDIELSYRNKKLSYDDFKYYVFNSRRLGWTNLDALCVIKPADQVNMHVAIKPAPNVDCKIVFKSIRSIMPGIRYSDHFEFPGIPKRQPAEIIAIKNEGGKPFLAIKQVITGPVSVDMEWKELTLDQLRQELRKLDE